MLLQGLTAHYLATSTYPLKQGDSCLVHAAAGGVGLLLCQMAKKRGAFVIGTASTPEKRELAREAGADEMIDYTTQDFAAETKRITGGRRRDGRLRLRRQHDVRQVARRLRRAGCSRCSANRAAPCRRSIHRFSTGRARSFSRDRRWRTMWRRERSSRNGRRNFSVGSKMER